MSDLLRVAADGAVGAVLRLAAASVFGLSALCRPARGNVQVQKQA